MKKSARIGLVLFLSGSVALATQDVDVPLRNWTVPPYAAASAGGGFSTMTDVSGPRAFIPITPCRIADTRGNGFTGQAGPPALTTTARSFQIAGTVPGIPSQCGIPSGASAVSFQFTIVTPNMAGNLVAWPGGTAPTASVLNWSSGETALGNGTIVPLGGSTISVQLNAGAAGATAHLVIDVNGYFSAQYEGGGGFLVVSHSTAAIRGDNDSTGDSSVAVQGVITSPTPGAGAIGVQGVILSSNAPTGTVGVRGANNGTGATGMGVWGSHVGSGWGVYGETNGGIGVFGKTFAATGATTGVRGDVVSVSYGAAGVYGRAGGVGLTSVYQASGVRGESTDIGTLGISPFLGVGGSLVSGGVEAAWGGLGHATGTNWGVYAFGPLEATGAKSFADPHPTDPSKVIRYISLEGPEPGTYFRGKGRFERGIARIVVPEDFRLVTDSEGLSVQITPIGAMASFAVMRVDLNEIVVQASRNVEFYYLVNGVRRTHKHLTSPIGEGTEFMPRSADAKMPLALTEGQKRALIQNGTYREDGTVNMETARRNGWDRIWAERERPAPMPE